MQLTNTGTGSSGSTVIHEERDPLIEVNHRGKERRQPSQYRPDLMSRGVRQDQYGWRWPAGPP
jgi:hypothetical protein